MEQRVPRVGHKKSRLGCAQCKKRHVKCNEEKPCSNCVRHNVPCSLAGGPNVTRDDAKPRSSISLSRSSSGISRSASQEGSQPPHSTSTMGAIDTTPLSSLTSSGTTSPFRVLSHFLGRHETALLPDPSQWRSDLALMHYYITEVQFRMYKNERIERVFHTEIPRIAFTCDYVMHALLGFSALSKAHAEPENAIALHPSAVDHFDKALVLYRQDASPLDASNANARFCFSWLVALFAFAMPPTKPPIDAVAELFLLAKGINSIISETWVAVSQGPLAPILAEGFQGGAASPAGPGGVPSARPLNTPEGMDYGLSHLDFLLGIEAMVPEERVVLALLLSELKALYHSLVAGAGMGAVSAILRFPKRQDAAPFADMLRKRRPQALVLLAYYCVLLDCLDDRWWMEGWAGRVMAEIQGTLEARWLHWVSWPAAVCLMKTGTPGFATGMGADNDLDIGMM